MRGPALEQARLEVQERLVRFEREGGDVAVLADRDRLEASVPVLLGAEHHPSAPGGVGDAEGAGQGSLGSVESRLDRCCHMSAPQVVLLLSQLRRQAIIAGCSSLARRIVSAGRLPRGRVLASVHPDDWDVVQHAIERSALYG